MTTWSPVDWLVERLLRLGLPELTLVGYVAGGIGLGITLLQAPFRARSQVAVVGIVCLTVAFLVFFYVSIRSSATA